MELLEIQKDGTLGKVVGELPAPAREVCQMMAKLYQKQGYEPPWIGYLALLYGSVVGTCSFKTAPQNGRVEIAYFTFPGYEGQGIATDMAGELVRRARAHTKGIHLFAQTLPRKNASTAVLTKLGFKFLGAVQHPDDGTVWEWAL